MADTGGAAVADDVELQRLKVGHDAGGLQVVGDHPGAGGEAGLDVGLDLQARLHRLLRQQAGADHHAGVGGVGAGGDGGDDHGAVGHLQLLGHGHAAGGAAERRQVVLAELVLEDLVEGVLHLEERHPVLGPARAGHARFDPAHVELQGGRVLRVDALHSVEEALLLEVALDELDVRLLAAGAAQVGEGDGVHREEAHGGAVLRRHVGDGRPVGQGELVQAGAVELDELLDDALLAQHLRHRQHQVGGGGALGQLAGQLEADDLGDQHVVRLSEHHRLSLDAAHAPAEHAQAVDHRRVRVGAHQRVGVGDAAPQLHDPAQVLQVDLVADAGPRRHGAEVSEALLRPLQEGVALAVALVFLLHIEEEGGVVAEGVDLDRVVDDQVDGDERVDTPGVAAELGDGGAHGGEVSHHGHAGKVLQQDPGRHEGDLPGLQGLGLPAAQGLDIFGGDQFAVDVAQQVLQQHADREGEPGNGRHAGLLQLIKAEEGSLA